MWFAKRSNHTLAWIQERTASVMREEGNVINEHGFSPPFVMTATGLIP